VPANQFLTVTEQQHGMVTVPSLTATITGGSPLQVTLTGQTNLLYVIEASTNLVHWTKSAVRTNLTGSVDWTDAAEAAHPQRFYRLVVP
jgi:hypothetical protein